MRERLNHLLARLFDAMAASAAPRFGIGWLEGVVGAAAAAAMLLWLTWPTPPAAPATLAEAARPAIPPAPQAEPAPESTPLVAMVVPPAPRARKAEPAWERFAVAPPPAAGRPQVALIIDDLGVDRKRAWRTIGLKGPLTLSFMAYASDLPSMAQAAHRAGHELMVHVPMEPLNPAADMGPNGLAVDLPRAEVLRRLRWDLGRFSGYVGINNHMGSRFTSDAESLTPVIEELKARGLLFVDSRTTAFSAGIAIARRLGVPSAARDVFLDNEADAPAIDERLAHLEHVARQHGTAIAIGHPHDATIEALSEWIAALPQKGIVLVPVSAIVRARSEEAATGARSAAQAGAGTQRAALGG
jgi:polysaccharide deacetylase 2 family uncharacterized protein YibQ